MKVIPLVLICVLYGSPHELLFDTNQSMGAGTFNPTTATSRKIPITFIGRVTSIEQLGKREIQVIPVEFDSRFAITVHIESVTPREVPLEGGTDQVFAVHSPVKLFRAVEEDIVGKRYRFKVTWNEVRNRSRFSGLSASPIEDEDTPRK